VSGASPHPLIDHERLTDLVEHRQARLITGPATLPPDPRAARAILHRRIRSVFLPASEVSGSTATVIAYISGALLNQTDEALAEICAPMPATPAAAPPPLPTTSHERLFRRLWSLSIHAQVASPATARVLAVLAHAFAQGRDDGVLQACRVYAETYGSAPLDPGRLYQNLPP
jgi:hypothetical protein